MNNQEQLRLPAYGGQAVIEGVLMRGKNHLAMAVRTPDGQIATLEESIPASKAPKFLRWPFFRGMVSLWESLHMGMRLLTKSANMQGGEEEQLEGKDLVFTVLLSVGLALLLFFLLPAFAAGLLEKYLQIHPWLSNLIEGLLRLLILILYMIFVGKMPDIARTYAYHGAEHKTINAFEAGAELTPEEVQKYTLVHPRCGTSFMLTMVLFSILVFSLLGPLPLHWRLISRVLMIPVITGIAYEYIRWAASAMNHSTFVRFLVKPNLALQNLTTREPSLEMLEVAIIAFNLMYHAESANGDESQCPS